jgi:hypothetical protein
MSIAQGKAQKAAAQARTRDGKGVEWITRCGMVVAGREYAVAEHSCGAGQDDRRVLA